MGHRYIEPPMRCVPPLCLLLACSGSPVGDTDGGSDAGFTEDAGHDAGVADAGPEFPPLTQEEQTVLGNRPYRLVVPGSYDAGTPVPFVMLLHGYTASGLQQDTYFRMSELAQARGFLLATPDGLIDGAGARYWNGTDYCCGFNTQRTDDVAYLTAIMNDVRLKHRVDPKRVFFIGHSNGGFMSHRMACDRSSRVAGIVSLAGAQWKDETKCGPTEKVPVLQVHGDMDGTVTYAGTALYPGAVETVGTWATLNGCGSALSSAGTDLDLVTTLAGSETKREHFAGCPAGIGVELWTIQSGGHVPAFGASWAPNIYDWLMAHPKP